MTLKIALIVDNERLPAWAAEAVSRLVGCDRIVVYSCTNTRVDRSFRRNWAYYLLNLLAIRVPETRAVPLGSACKPVSKVVRFQSEYEGAWQKLPRSLLDTIDGDRPDVILKFGMSLMRVPPAHELGAPVLSFHHGNPDFFRGRPAGFYETVQNVPVIGQVVQVISNQLDAGRIVAFAETKVYRHSYRATMREAFRHSPLLLQKAVQTALEGKSLDFACGGKNYRLPSNILVGRFCARMAWSWCKRIAYGALVEKKWRVAIAPAQIDTDRPVEACIARSSDWEVLPLPRGYAFAADPFFAPGGGVIVEALSRRTGKGALVLIGDGEFTDLTGAERHHSYPFTFTDNEVDFVLPEIAGWGPPRLYRLQSSELRESSMLCVEGQPHLIDPTLFESSGRYYLFANTNKEGSNVLRLWHSPSLKEKFTEHPSSPVRISPVGGRMGGALIHRGKRLLRPGQDGSRGYGDGIVLYEVLEMTSTSYREIEIDRLAFDEFSGPHTLNFKEGHALFDFYQEEVSLGAGLRRLFARFSI